MASNLNTRLAATAFALFAASCAHAFDLAKVKSAQGSSWADELLVKS